MDPKTGKPVKFRPTAQQIVKNMKKEENSDAFVLDFGAMQKKKTEYFFEDMKEDKRFERYDEVMEDIDETAKEI